MKCDLYTSDSACFPPALFGGNLITVIPLLPALVLQKFLYLVIPRASPALQVGSLLSEPPGKPAQMVSGIKQLSVHRIAHKARKCCSQDPRASPGRGLVGALPICGPRDGHSQDSMHRL